MLIHDLVYAEPHSIIVVVKTEHVIDEGLGFGVVLGGVESLVKHLFDELQMRLRVERAIKGQ